MNATPIATMDGTVLSATKPHSTATPEIMEGLPLFMTEEGEKEIDMRRKELETYVKLLSKTPRDIINRTFVNLNPHTLNPNEVGQKDAAEIKEWWSKKETHKAVIEWFSTNKHKVNGKFGNWSCGFMGSRWADCLINGRKCRFAFYSRKYNPSSFPEQMERDTGKVLNYAIMIDPTL